MKEQIKLQTKGASIEAPKEKAARERFIYNSWRDVFRAHSNGYERVADIINPLNKPEVHTMLGESLGEDTVKEILQKLKDECTSIQDEIIFIERVSNILAPIFNVFLSGSDEKLQAKKRERFAEEGGKPINELFFYEIDDKTVHIHLAPAEDFSIYKVRTLFKEGLLKLADIVEVNKDINTICGTSWILGSEKGKSIAEKLGFTFEGINQNNEGEISITREKFLELYLK